MVKMLFQSNFKTIVYNTTMTRVFFVSVDYS